MWRVTLLVAASAFLYVATGADRPREGPAVATLSFNADLSNFADDVCVDVLRADDALARRAAPDHAPPPHTPADLAPRTAELAPLIRRLCDGTPSVLGLAFATHDAPAASALVSPPIGFAPTGR